MIVHFLFNSDVFRDWLSNDNRLFWRVRELNEAQRGRTQVLLVAASVSILLFWLFGLADEEEAQVSEISRC